jgi:biopolymer transport protein ExbD
MAATDPGINRVVTPMLDMTFQLLFFFLFMFRPQIAEGQIDFALPRVGQGDPGEVANEGIQEEARDEYHIAAYGTKGKIEKLTFRVKQFDAEVLPADKMMEALAARLTAIPKLAKGARPPSISIEIDKRLNYSEVIRLLDLCRTLGFKDVGVMPLANPDR